MSQKSLSRWLYAIILLVAVTMAAVYLFILPMPGIGFFGEAHGSALHTPWLIFLSFTSLPILIALVYAWLIARNIGLDRSFSLANAHHLRAIAYLAAADGGYYFLGSLVFFLLQPMAALSLLAPAVLTLFAFAVAVAAAALSHLVLKAAALQEQSDLTI